jgi:hypothetical protein
MRLDAKLAPKESHRFRYQPIRVFALTKLNNDGC